MAEVDVKGGDLIVLIADPFSSGTLALKVEIMFNLTVVPPKST